MHEDGRSVRPRRITKQQERVRLDWPNPPTAFRPSGGPGLLLRAAPAVRGGRGRLLRAELPVLGRWGRGRPAHPDSPARAGAGELRVQRRAEVLAASCVLWNFL